MQQKTSSLPNWLHMNMLNAKFNTCRNIFFVAMMFVIFAQEYRLDFGPESTNRTYVMFNFIIE